MTTAPTKSISARRLLGIPALLAGLAFLAALGGTLILTFAQPRFHSPVTGHQGVTPEAHPEPALSISILIPHDAVRETAKLLQDTAKHRSWTLQRQGKESLLTLPLQDLPMLQEANTQPGAALRTLAADTRPAPSSSTAITVRVDWQLQSPPLANLAASALTPTFFAALLTGALYLTGLGLSNTSTKTASQVHPP